MSFWSRHLRQSVVGLGLRELLGGGREVVLVDIAQGHDVLALDPVEVVGAPAPDTDGGDVELLIRRVAGLENPGFENSDTGPEGGRVREERATIDLPAHGSPPVDITQLLLMAHAERVIRGTTGFKNIFVTPPGRPVVVLRG